MEKDSELSGQLASSWFQSIGHDQVAQRFQSEKESSMPSYFGLSLQLRPLPQKQSLCWWSLFPPSHGVSLSVLHFQENSTQRLRMSLNLSSPCLFLTFCLHFYIPPFIKASSHKPGHGGRGANSDLCWAPSWEIGKENKLGLQIILCNKQTPVGNRLWQHYNWACEWPPRRCLGG